MTSSVSQSNANRPFFSEHTNIIASKGSTSSNAKVLEVGKIQVSKWPSAAKMAALGFAAILGSASAYYISRAFSDTPNLQKSSVKLDIPKTGFDVPVNIPSNTQEILNSPLPKFHEDKLAASQAIDEQKEIPHGKTLESPPPLLDQILNVHYIEDQNADLSNIDSNAPITFASSEVINVNSSTKSWAVGVGLSAVVILASVLGLRHLFNKPNQKTPVQLVDPVTLTASQKQIDTTKRPSIVQEKPSSSNKPHEDTTENRDNTGKYNTEKQAEDIFGGDGLTSTEELVVIVAPLTENLTPFVIKVENSDAEIEKPKSNLGTQEVIKLEENQNPKKRIKLPLNSTNSDSPPTYLPPLLPDTSVINTNYVPTIPSSAQQASVNEIPPPSDLPPTLENHPCYKLGMTCHEVYSTEITFSEKLWVMSKLITYFTDDRIQALCNDENIPSDLSKTLKAAMKELLHSGNLEIIRKFSSSILDYLGRYEEDLKISDAHPEQDAASILFAEAITFQQKEMTDEVFNAAFWHIQALTDISRILMESTSQIKKDGILNPEEKVPKSPWEKSIQQFVRENRSLNLEDLSFEGLFIAVTQRFPHLQLLSKDLIKHVEALNELKLIPSTKEFADVVQSQTLKLNERLRQQNLAQKELQKKRDLIQQTLNIVAVLEESKIKGNKLVLDENSQIISKTSSKRESLKEMLIGSTSEAYIIAKNQLVECIHILNAKLPNEGLTKYNSETDEEFNQRINQRIEIDNSMLKIFNTCLEYTNAKLLKKSSRSNSKDELLIPAEELKSDVEGITNSSEGSVDGNSKKIHKGIMGGLRNIKDHTPRIFTSK